MFEAGGQPISGAGGVIPDPIEKGLPDLPTNAFFQYGVYEGVPRLLDLMDKHQVKLSSFMIGQAVEKAPDLAREIVRRGHEAAAHGRTWENSYFLDPDAERRFIADSVESIQKVTRKQPIGWNAYWMRNSPHTLDILQSLGFKYHIDEPSMDEPFIVKLKGGDFVTVPYTFHMNDIVSFPFDGWNPAAYEQALKDEFDQLYEEGAQRRRMMVVSLHDAFQDMRIASECSTVSSTTRAQSPACGSPAKTRSRLSPLSITRSRRSMTVVLPPLAACRVQRSKANGSEHHGTKSQMRSCASSWRPEFYSYSSWRSPPPCLPRARRSMMPPPLPWRSRRN